MFKELKINLTAATYDFVLFAVLQVARNVGRVSLLIAATWPQSSQVAERVTPSLQLASLFSMCKFVASCKKNRIVHVTGPLLREGKFQNAIYLTHLYA